MYIGNTDNVPLLQIGQAVYPYVYREHCARINKLARHIGLSLCIQGTQLILKYKSRSKRFIPMCIGNTFANFLALELTSVYPYVYREHTGTPLSTYIYSGLSLCVQGTLFGLFRLQNSQRFIPMCIGNTRSSPYKLSNPPVYPYVYREHDIEPEQRERYYGLSLCVQGTLYTNNTSRIYMRFIPMCIGNTFT